MIYPSAAEIAGLSDAGWKIASARGADIDWVTRGIGDLMEIQTLFFPNWQNSSYVLEQRDSETEPVVVLQYAFDDLPKATAAADEWREAAANARSYGDLYLALKRGRPNIAVKHFNPENERIFKRWVREARMR